MTGIIGSLGYVGETNERLFELANAVAERGNSEDYSLLKEELKQAIGARNGLSEEEIKIVSEILSGTHYEEVRTGSYLDKLNELICFADGELENSVRKQEALRGIFRQNLPHLQNHFEMLHREEEFKDLKKGNFPVRFLA